MRKAAFCYLFVFLILFLAGCAGGESAGLSEQEENASSVPGETVSSWPDDQ